MKLPRSPLSRLLAFTLTGAAGLALLPATTPVRAADHGDAPSISGDSAADLADAFLFLDPNDNTKVIISLTVRGFIIPGEALNLAAFDPKVRFYLNIDNDGDAIPDKVVEVSFAKKALASTDPQVATINFDGVTYTAMSTAATLAATPNPQVVTSLGNSGIKFYAGEVDDPFFFDLVAFNRFVASVKKGTPDPTVFNRGRDTFAGYNVLCIAFSVPVNLLKGQGNTIGLETRTKRRMQVPLRTGGYESKGRYLTVDRTGNPTVNVALIPFARKDEYNAAKASEDIAGKFAADIVASLKGLGTDDAHIAILADVAVTHGDLLHLDVTIPNTGPEGGTNAAAGFPNGRRPADDTIDTVLTVINNGTPVSDHVDASDVLPQDVFPFFGLPHQPLQDTAETDDDTRN